MMEASLKGCLFFIAMALYQNQKNGQIVEFIARHDKEWAQVKNAAGVVQYVALADHQSYEPAKGKTQSLKHI